MKEIVDFYISEIQKNPVEGFNHLSELLNDNKEAFYHFPQNISQYFDYYLNANSEDLIIATINCISAFIKADARGAQYIIDTKINEIIDNYLINMRSLKIAEACHHCLASYIMYPEMIAKGIIQPHYLLINFHYFSLTEQRAIIRIITDLNDVYVGYNFIYYHLPKLCDLITFPDPKISNDVCSIIHSITNSRFVKIHISTIEKIVVSLQVLTDVVSIRKLLESLIAFCKYSPKLARAAIDVPIDFGIILERLGSASNNSNSQHSNQISDHITSNVSDNTNNTNNNNLISYENICAIQNVYKMPQNIIDLIVDFIEIIIGVDGFRKLANASYFAYSVQPILTKFLVENIGDIRKIMRVLADTYDVYQPDDCYKVLHALIHYSSLNLDMINDIQYIFGKLPTNMKTKNLKTYYNTEENSDCSNNENINTNSSEIDDGKIDDKEIGEEEMMKICELPSSTFAMKEQLQTKVLLFIKNLKKDSINSQSLIILKKLVQICQTMLKYQTFQEEENMLQVVEKKGFKINVIIRNQEKSQNFPKSFYRNGYLLEQESYYNYKSQNISKNCILDTNTDTSLLKLVKIDLNNPMKSHLSLMMHAQCPPGYKHCYFKFKEQSFSIYESLISVLIRECKNVKELLIERLYFDVTEFPENHIIGPEMSLQRHLIKYTGTDIKNIKNYLLILNEIHSLVPELQLENEVFAHNALSKINSIGVVFNPKCSALRLFVLYPFLFPIESRLIFLKLTSMSPDICTRTISREITKDGENSPELVVTRRLSISVDRNAIFENGIHIFTHFSAGGFVLDTQFVDEFGIGRGPSMEFFRLFAIELQRKSHKIWLYDTDNNINNNGTAVSEYVQRNEGLFPSPCASENPNLFFVMGAFIAKSIEMEIPLPMHFSPAFFKLLHGQALSVSDISEQYGKSLQFPEGLEDLPFTFPGFDDVELIKNGKKTFVTKDNVDVYIKSFSDKITCKEYGPGFGKCGEMFREGFGRVIPWESTFIFTPSELCHILVGQNEFTYNDLIDNVIIGSGFSSDSPIILWFFEIVSELAQEEKRLFIRFITGSESFGIGGIKSLHPKLTIARKDFVSQNKSDLPSVMTCSNYLKIPEYETKEKLKEKLLYAMREGQSSFQMT